MAYCLNDFVKEMRNAQWGNLVIAVDSVSNSGNLPTNHKAILNPDEYSPLNNDYTSTISGLSSKTKYYIFLRYSGTFDIGGPNEMGIFNIGEGKIVTTN